MVVERLSPVVRRILAPNPSPWTLEGTNTYLVGDTEPIVLDPGPLIESHLEAIVEAAGTLGGILLTHRHSDHAENAEELSGRTGMPVIDADTVEAGGSLLRRIPTPGHSSDHRCFLLESEHALFSGDHVLGRGTTVVAYPDGDMRQYLESLDAVRALAPARMYPGHGPVIEEPTTVLDYYAKHRLERETRILSVLRDEARSLEEVLSEAYDDVPEAVLPAARLSLRAHLVKLEADGLAVESEAGWRRNIDGRT